MRVKEIQEKVEAVLNGSLRIQRFNAAEQGGSSDASDRLLWTGLLLAESELASTDCGGVFPGEASAPGGSPRPSRFLTSISRPLPPSFDALAFQLGRYEDRGHESLVFDAGDGFVNKLRLMRPSLLSGYIAPLAAVVYHNRWKVGV